MLVIRGRYIEGFVNAAGEYELGADHRQVARLLLHVSRVHGVPIRAYRQGQVASLAVAIPNRGLIAIDANLANQLVVLHGETALLFAVLHELGHLRYPHVRGRRGERVADVFAAQALLSLGYSPSDVVRGAAVTLMLSVDDGVHDDGWKRVELVRRSVARFVA